MKQLPELVFAQMKEQQIRFHKNILDVLELLVHDLREDIQELKQK